MPPKTNANKWSDVQLAIAAISMTAVIAFWNTFAGPDKVKAEDKAAADQQALLLPTVTPAPIIEEPTPLVTMPPTGYTILFGGAAPKPQVIVVAKPKNNGGGGGNNNGGGGGSAASQPAVTTNSS